MRIGMVTQWYEPEPGAAAHPTAIARALAARGHEVRVLTGFPSYPQGKVYPGYRMRWRQHETRDGISLLRVPDLPSHDQNALRRGLSLTSFAVSATAQVAWLRDSDVILTYLTPATVGLAPWVLRRLRGVPYVLYVQDLWPETITASGFIGNARANAAVERALHRGLRTLYADAADVIAISPSMARSLARRGSPRDPQTVPNWVDESVFAPAQEWSRELPSGRRWFMYAGGMGEVQALDAAVRAIALLGDREDVGLAFVGDGVARQGLERLADRLGVSDRVLFLGSRPMTEMPALMAQSLAQLVSLRDLPLFRGTVPSKIQASMACGVPIVCAVAGDAADLVRSTGAGVVVDPESPEAIAEAFRALADLHEEELASMGERGRAAYATRLSAAAGAREIERILEAAVERRSM